MFTKGQFGELAMVTSSNIPSLLKWFLGPFSDFASSLMHININNVSNTFSHSPSAVFLHHAYMQPARLNNLWVCSENNIGVGLIDN